MNRRDFLKIAVAGAAVPTELLERIVAPRAVTIYPAGAINFAQWVAPLVDTILANNRMIVACQKHATNPTNRWKPDAHYFGDMEVNG